MKNIAIVPARAGSKGLPNKNTRDLCGIPLYRHSVNTAIAAGFAEIYVSTDIEEIFTHDLPDNVIAVRRPVHLAGDEVEMAEVLHHVLSSQCLNGSMITLLQPTSPLRKPTSVRKATDIFEDGNYSLVLSVCEAPNTVLKWGTINGNRFDTIADPRFCFMNRQNLPTVYRPNGAIYTFAADQFMRDANFSTLSIGVVEMPLEESYDVDTAEDFHQCELVMREGE